MLKNKRYVLKYIGISLFLFIFFMICGYQTSEYSKQIIVDDFIYLTSVISNENYDINELYDKYNIVLLTYENEILIEKPDNYLIQPLFDIYEYKASTLCKDNVGYFVYVKYTTNNLERMYIKRINTNDFIDLNFLFKFFVFLFTIFIISIIYTYKIDNYKRRLFLKISNSLTFEISDEIDDLDVLIRDINQITAYSQLIKNFLAYSEEGLLILDGNGKMLFKNSLASQFIKDGNIMNVNLSTAINKCLVDEFSKGEFSFEDKYFRYYTTCKKINNLNYYAIYITDISDIEMFKQNQVKFYNQASHELRTPLTTIQGLVELLLICDLDEENKLKTLDMSFAECRRLDYLISSIVDISKRFKVDDLYTKINLTNMINDILEKFNMFNYIECSSNIPKNVMLLCNPPKLQTIIETLICNAYEHNYEKGKVYVDLICDELYLELNIKNTYKGIENITNKEIFNKYFNSERNDSTSLGLSLATSLCETYKYEINFSADDEFCFVQLKFFSKK